MIFYGRYDDIDDVDDILFCSLEISLQSSKEKHHKSHEIP